MDGRKGKASFELSWEQYIPLTDRFMVYDFLKVFIASVAIMQVLLLVMSFFID